MRLSRFAFLALWLAALCLASLRPCAAQTYTPKQIRFEGGGDPAELMRITGLKSGAPVTKAQIDAAIGKLADTGAFTDLSYTVNADALIIKLGGAVAASGQTLPVRYVNLVWWQPEELTKLLEARVPLFHGELPLTGTLTDQVRAALVQLLAEKGVENARVETMPTSVGAGGGTHAGMAALALNVASPEIVLGQLSLSGAAPTTQKQLDVVTGKLGMQEFESDVTAKAIRDNVGDTEKNAGFLDATVDPPAFSAPHKDMNGYAVDATATVRPGELYRFGAVDLGTKPPMTDAEAARVADLKTGSPAGAMETVIAQGSLQRAYRDHGHLDARVDLQTHLDHETHTEAVRLLVTPGELYHLAAVDTTALPLDLQTTFAREFRGKPGMEAGQPLNSELARTLHAIHAPSHLRITLRSMPAQHTLTVVLAPENVSHEIQPPTQ